MNFGRRRSSHKGHIQQEMPKSIERIKELIGDSRKVLGIQRPEMHQADPSQVLKNIGQYLIDQQMMHQQTQFGQESETMRLMAKENIPVQNFDKKGDFRVGEKKPGKIREKSRQRLQRQKEVHEKQKLLASMIRHQPSLPMSPGKTKNFSQATQNYSLLKLSSDIPASKLTVTTLTDTLGINNQTLDENGVIDGYYEKLQQGSLNPQSYSTIEQTKMLMQGAHQFQSSTNPNQVYQLNTIDTNSERHKAIRRPNSGGIYLEGMSSHHQTSQEKDPQNKAYRLFLDQNLRILQESIEQLQSSQMQVSEQNSEGNFMTDDLRDFDGSKITQTSGNLQIAKEKPLSEQVSNGLTNGISDMINIQGLSTYNNLYEDSQSEKWNQTLEGEFQTKGFERKNFKNNFSEKPPQLTNHGEKIHYRASDERIKPNQLTQKAIGDIPANFYGSKGPSKIQEKILRKLLKLKDYLVETLEGISSREMQGYQEDEEDVNRTIRNIQAIQDELNKLVQIEHFSSQNLAEKYPSINIMNEQSTQVSQSSNFYKPHRDVPTQSACIQTSMCESQPKGCLEARRKSLGKKVMFDEKIQTSLDLQESKEYPVAKMVGQSQISPQFDSRTDWNSTPHKRDFLSFGERNQEHPKFFKDTLDYEKRLKIIDQEEAELRFMKMKHKQKLQKDIEELDRNFQSPAKPQQISEDFQNFGSRVDEVVMANSQKKDECKNLLFPEFSRKKSSCDVSSQVKGILKNPRSQGQSLKESGLVESRKVSSSKIDLLIEQNKCQQFQIESLKLENQKKIEDLSKKIYRLSSKKNSVCQLSKPPESSENDLSRCSKELNFASFEEGRQDQCHSMVYSEYNQGTNAEGMYTQKLNANCHYKSQGNHSLDLNHIQNNTADFNYNTLTDYENMCRTLQSHPSPQEYAISLLSRDDLLNTDQEDRLYRLELLAGQFQEILKHQETQVPVANLLESKQVQSQFGFSGLTYPATQNPAEIYHNRSGPISRNNSHDCSSKNIKLSDVSRNQTSLSQSMATSNPRIDRLVNGERIAVNYDSDLVKETASKYQRLPEQQVQMKQIERKESAAWRKNKVKIYNQLIRERNKSKSRSATKSAGRKGQQKTQ